MLDSKVVADLQALEHLYEEWKALAAASALPLMAPGWSLAWWRHHAPPQALVRAVEVRDGATLVGLAPFFAVPPRRGHRVAYRLLGCGSGAPIAPLALPGREWKVAKAIGQALIQADPSPDIIELAGTPLASRWRSAIRDCWPGRKPISCAYKTQACPTVSLRDTSLAAWLAGRSSRFRSSMRRLKRRFAEVGGIWRMSTEATLPSDIELFLRLHSGRWAGRGGSALVANATRVESMLKDAARTMIAGEHFRLWVMEIEGEAIAADLYLAEGGVVVGVNGGWDERWKRLSPPLLATMHTIEDSIERRESRLYLGPGGGSHKTRFANGDSPVACQALMIPGRRLPRTLALTAPVLAGGAVRSHAERVLNPAQVHKLRTLRHRARRAGATR